MSDHCRSLVEPRSSHFQVIGYAVLLALRHSRFFPKRLNEERHPAHDPDNGETGGTIVQSIRGMPLAERHVARVSTS